VTLTDEADKTPITSLGDGAEVAILGWRPGWAGNIRYHVRAMDSGLEGWLPVASLRGTEATVPSAVTTLPPPVHNPARLRVEESGHRFGQRK